MNFLIKIIFYSSFLFCLSACNTSNEFVGDWFILYGQDDGDDSKGLIEASISINEDNTFVLYGNKTEKGTWVKIQDTLNLTFEDTTDVYAKCYFDKEYLKVKFNKYSLAAIKLPKSAINESVFLKDRFFEMKIHDDKIIKLDFFDNDSVCIINNENDWKGSGVASYTWKNIGNIKFLRVNEYRYTFYFYKKSKDTLKLLDFTWEHLYSTNHYNISDMYEIEINEDSISKNNRKFLANWNLKDVKIPNWVNDSYNLKKFELSIENDSAQFEIVSSEDSVYKYKLRYKFNRTGDCLIFEKNDETPTFSVSLDPQTGNLLTNYSVKFGEKQLRHPFIIELEKVPAPSIND